VTIGLVQKVEVGEEPRCRFEPIVATKERRGRAEGAAEWAAPPGLNVDYLEAEGFDRIAVIGRKGQRIELDDRSRRRVAANLASMAVADPGHLPEMRAAEPLDHRQQALLALAASDGVEHVKARQDRLVQNRGMRAAQQDRQVASQPLQPACRFGDTMEIAPQRGEADDVRPQLQDLLGDAAIQRGVEA
jgi:hypothetical protein